MGIWYDIWYTMYDIWYIIFDIWYLIWYDMIWWNCGIETTSMICVETFRLYIATSHEHWVVFRFIGHLNSCWWYFWCFLMWLEAPKYGGFLSIAKGDPRYDPSDLSFALGKKHGETVCRAHDWTSPGWCNNMYPHLETDNHGHHGQLQDV